jgi:vitamin B12 transporter
MTRSIRHQVHGKRKEKKKSNTILAFRCWTRKKYAAFNSIKKVVKICTLCIAYNMVAIPAETIAQVNGDSLKMKSIDIGDIIVTAGRTLVEEQQATRIVTVISKAEIERAPAQSFNDLLRYIAGVDIRQRGPLGVQADISLRGGTFDQTLILLNGINITDPQTGHHNLNLPIDIESIEQIEILQGPAAKSFGANAFNGVINIITGNSGPNHTRASGTYGQYGLYKASANISNTNGNFNHFISFNNLGSDGYIRNTDFTNTNIFYQAGYLSGIGTFDFQTGYNKKDFAANSFYSLRFPNQFEATKTEFVSLRYQSNTSIKISSAFYTRRQRDRFELRRDTLPFNHHITNTAGINLYATATHRFGKTSIGIDFRNEHIISNVLGIPLNNTIEVSGFEDAYYTNYYNRINTGIYADHSVTLKRFTFVAGTLAFHNSRVPGVRIYPGIDVSYSLTNYVKLYSSANKTLRTPTFTDLFYKSPSQKGNRYLLPEEAITLEGGMKYNNASFTANISVFKRYGLKMIDWVKDPSPDSIIWRSMNHSQINFTGMESSFSYIPSTAGNLERIQSFKISYSFLRADLNTGNMLSKYTLDYLKHQITSGIDVRVKWKLFVSNRLTYNDRNGTYQDNKGQLVTYKPFWTDDVKVYWKSDYLTLFTEASNVFNTNYYDFGGIVQPGIWFRGGIIVDIDYKKTKE